MKKFLLPSLAIAVSLLCLPAFSQDKVDTTNKLGLAGDNLDLYAVLDLFQNSKTIEAFEKSLNDKENKINNLDLDLDKKVDFIKVVTEKKDKKDDDSHMFILRVDVSKKESQDVAVILLDRDKDKKVSLQIVGDEELYGKDYVIEPKGNSSVTPNPGYKGSDPVTVTVEAPATNVVVQQAPVVQYVYSPAYVPYYPPYYYGYYPGWFAFSAVVSWGMYASFHNHYHGGYYGGHYGGGNTVIINNGDKINHYKNNDRRGSDRVSDNRARGNYGNGSLDHGRGGGLSSTRPSTRPAGGASTRPGGGGASASTRPSTGGPGGSASTRPSTADRSGSGLSSSNRASTSNRSSSNFNSPSTRSSSYGGGGRSMSGGGGGFRGGGGGGRRR